MSPIEPSAPERTSLGSSTSESSDSSLDILYFHRFQTEAELICGLLDHSGATVTAVSTEFPGRLSTTLAPDAVLVDPQSADAWGHLERLLSFSGCRLVADLHPPALDTDNTPRGRYDGRVFLDLSLPPWELMRRVVDAVARCHGNGTTDVRPTGRASPPVERIARGNPTDERILALIAFGMSDKEIAGSLCLSPQTVRNRISRLLHEGSFNNRTALAVHFLRETRTDILDRISVPPGTTPGNAHG